ncbi:extracellular solute-binding protein [Inquilinus limosus]|uniref:extracellular solute-binding protein n=1 Tax=Inquilinus limosus TaxID=171674 RepID=UPI003F15BF4B
MRVARLLLRLALAALLPGALPAAAQTQAETPAAAGGGIAMHGQPKYPPGFDHFAYANPDAPKGGELRQALIGSFDSLNPFIVGGRRDQIISIVPPYHFAQLMARSYDEPFSLYPYVADRVEMPDDRRSITFHINPKAVFHDGTPITADDVIFTAQALGTKGLPTSRALYDRIASVDRLDDRTVRFTFKEEASREAPLVVALQPVLSKAWYTTHPFDQPSLDIPLGAGPYKITQVDPGRSIVLERVKDWWGADLPAMRGQHNFDVMRYDFYLDDDVALEAFKAGAYTLRREWNAEKWVGGAYDFPAAQDGRVTLLTLPHFRPAGMMGFAMNSRKPLFADPRVRRAMILAFDFEWVNKTLLGGQYKRDDSFFANSPLAATDTPKGAELKLLEPFRDQLPPQLFTEPYTLPPSDGSGRNRENLRAAQALLAEAGWTIRDNTLIDGSGAPFRFEILLQDKTYQRIALAYADQLRRLGVAASVRLVDSAQYRNRTETYDFDMLLNKWLVTLSPGSEQMVYWGSRSADAPGTRNYAGVKSTAVDELIETVTNARSQEELEAAVHALDRVLLWGNYVVPLYYLDRDYIAYWGNLGRVTTVNPTYGTVLEAWWANSK